LPIKFDPTQKTPHAQAEFTLSAAQIAEALGEQVDPKKPPELEEGEWKLVARVPKDKQEIFVPAEHVSDEVVVRIVKRPLRVLLFAGGSNKDYQFVRTLFVRETDKRRAELSVYLQPAPGRSDVRQGIVQDVPPERLLTTFPTILEEDEDRVKPEDRFYN